MSEVKRYNVKLVGNMEPSPTGDWITFWDHLDATAELRRGLEGERKLADAARRYVCAQNEYRKNPSTESSANLSIVAAELEALVANPEQWLGFAKWVHKRELEQAESERDTLKREVEELRERNKTLSRLAGMWLVEVVESAVNLIQKFKAEGVDPEEYRGLEGDLDRLEAVLRPKLDAALNQREK